MKQIQVGIIGTGWCGGIRAVACSRSALVGGLHLAESDPTRLADVAEAASPTSTTDDWETLVARDEIDAILVSATPETLHFPMARAALAAGKHVLLEKPIALTLDEADELIELAEDGDLKFTIGYSQRFNAKQAMVKRAVADGTLGDISSILVSRHITRSLGAKISTRTKLSPAAMEATHDLDFAFWCLEPRRPVRVYSQNAWGIRKDTLGVPDTQYVLVTMDDGTVVTIGAGMSLPAGYPNQSTTWIEVIGTEGAVIADASHRDIVVNTVANGVQFPLSTMPGEYVDHMYAGPMERETTHFLEAVVHDRPVMVDPRLARMTMEVYLAADLSAETHEVVTLPLTSDQSGLALRISTSTGPDVATADEWWQDLAPVVPETTAVRPTYRTVDVHTHLSVPAGTALAAPYLEPEYEPRSRYSSPETLRYNKELRASARQTGQFEDAEVRLADMDRQGIDMQVLSVPPTEYFYWLEEKEALAACRLQHERFAEVVAAHPARFAAVANVPLGHPELAVEVLREARDDFGFHGFEMSADVVGLDLDDARYDVVWEAAVELGMTAIMHPQGFTHGERFTDYYLVNVMCMPLASALATTKMILGGVWQRHPDLQMVVVHGGGYLPFYSARTDHAYAVRPELRRHIDRPPSDYLAKLYFDTNVFDPGMVRHLVDRFGADHVLLGTDYPFDMGTVDPLGFLERADLTDEERRLVLGGNAERLLRIGG